ncbi:MAG TPA: WbqC family protein [Thermodesulfobacteriota bacterium]|nr:WbqC family protein [Thermodesulfobacteriota bacterium]
MIVACHQPNFLPWIGFFYKALLADLLVLLDDVQFARGFTWVNRNRLKCDQGELWLTVPVKKKGRGLQKIKDVEVNDEGGNWPRKFFQGISQNYAHAPYLAEHRAFLTELMQVRWKKLVDLNVATIYYLAGSLGVGNKIVLQSSLHTQSQGSELLVKIAQKTGADVYLTPLVSKKYVDEDLFAQQGISIRFFKFIPPVYPQLWGEFIYNLSALDLLLNCGGKSLEVIKEYNHVK